MATATKERPAPKKTQEQGLERRIEKLEYWIDKNSSELMTGNRARQMRENRLIKHKLDVELALLRGEEPPAMPDDLRDQTPDGKRIEMLEEAFVNLQKTVQDQSKAIQKLTDMVANGRGSK